MKKSYALYGFAIILLYGMLLSGCKKETGPQGPEGNANVHATIHVVQPTDWDVHATYLLKLLVDSNITQDIIDKGSVEMFVQFGTQWYPLPYSYHNTGYFGTYTGSYSKNQVRVEYERSDEQQPAVPLTAISFKVVAIGGQ